MKSLLSYSTVTVFVCLTSSLMQEELDGMAKNYPDRFKIYYVLNQVYLYFPIISWYPTMLRSSVCLTKHASFPAQPPEVWDGGVGFVSKEMIQTHCPAPAADIQVSFSGYWKYFEGTWMGAISFCSVEVRSVFRFQVLRCGPPPMNKAMAAHLDGLGYTKEMQFQF